MVVVGLAQIEVEIIKMKCDLIQRAAMKLDQIWQQSCHHATNRTSNNDLTRYHNIGSNNGTLQFTNIMISGF